MKNLFSFSSNHLCNLSCNPHFQIIQESLLLLPCEVLDRQLVHLTVSTASSFLYHCYQRTRILVDSIYVILVKLLWVLPCIIQIWSFQSSDVQRSVPIWSAVWKWNYYLVFWKLPLSPSSEDIVMSVIAIHCTYTCAAHFPVWTCVAQEAENRAWQAGFTPTFFVFSPLLEVLHFHTLKPSMYYMFLLDHAH